MVDQSANPTRFASCGYILVLEKCDLAARYVETLLFRLGEERPLVHRQFRVVDKGVGCVVVFHSGIPALVRESEKRWEWAGDNG